MATPAQLAKCNSNQQDGSKSGGGPRAGLKNGMDMQGGQEQDDNSQDVPEQKRPAPKRKSAKSRAAAAAAAAAQAQQAQQMQQQQQQQQQNNNNQGNNNNMNNNTMEGGFSDGNEGESRYHPHHQQQQQQHGGPQQEYPPHAGGPGPHGGAGDMNDVYGGQSRLPPPHSPSSYGMPEHHHPQQHPGQAQDMGPMYDQYGGRANYSPNAKQMGGAGGGSHLVRSAGGGPPMMVPYNASSQRYLGGGGGSGPPSVSQHIGPTPTLNQLLQSPNPVHRYQSNSYAQGEAGVGGGGSWGANHSKGGATGAPGPPGGSNGGSEPAPAPAGPYPNWSAGAGNMRPHMNMYQAPITNNQSAVGYRNQGGPLHDVGGHSAGKRPVQPQATYMGPGGNSPYSTGGAPGGNGGGGGHSPQQQSSSQATPSSGLQPPPPSPHSQFNQTQYPPPHRYSSPSPQGPQGAGGRNSMQANQPYSPQMTHQYPPQQQQQQQGMSPSPMAVYDQRYHSMAISPQQQQQQQQQQHCPQNYGMGRGAPQQQGLPLPPSSAQPPSSTSSTSSTRTQQSPSPHGQQQQQMSQGGMGGGGGAPQPPFSSSNAQQQHSAQNKDGCEQLVANSTTNNVETTGSVDDALSDSSNQSLSSNQGGGGGGGGGGGSQSAVGGGAPPAAGVSPLRPTPSPSGSSGSRSMSPAVGPQQLQQTSLPSQQQQQQQQNIPMPPRPSSGQSEGGQQQRVSQSPMAAAQGYSSIPPSQMGPPMYGGKMHANMLAPYSPQSQPYPSGKMEQHNFVGGNSNRNPNSGGGGGGGQGVGGVVGGGMGVQSYNNYHGGGHPYANRVSPQGYPNQYLNNQYAGQNYPQPQQQQQQQPQPPLSHPMAGVGQVGGGKVGGAIPPGAQVAVQAVIAAAAAVSSSPGAPSSGRHASPYMKQHMGPQRGYGPGPMSAMNYNSGMPGGVPSQMGMMGPGGGGGGNRDSPVMQMPPPAPPTSSTTPTPSNNMMMGGPPGHPGGVSSANSTPPHLASAVGGGNLSENSCDNSNESNTPSMGSGQGDLRGLPLSLGMPNNDSGGPIHDEASQHSTASNNSTADERAETPRPKKDIHMSHPPTPASALPSPGAASMSSYHDEFESVSSPSWPRTPASPVVNSQHHEYHPKVSFKNRPDGLHKLYDISDEPDRRHFLDRLISFNEERGSTITQCPTISKHPLDLFRLYLGVKERGGFLEVTKGKLWKEVAGIVGVGASSSGAYTLRKQYIKHLLPFECKFDQGGIDPRPIISQLESTTRKKNPKTVAAPSPGSSNSQDSFQQNNNQSLDSFPPASTPYSGNQYPPSGHGAPPNDYGCNVNVDSHHPSPMLPNHNAHPAGSGGGGGAGAAPMLVGSANPPDSINVQNPFADDIPHLYSRNGMASGGGGGGGGAGQSVVAPQTAYPYGHHRPQTLASNYPAPNQSGTASQYPYPESMNRVGGPPSQRPPMQPPPHDQYPADNYRRPPMPNHEGYQNRPILEQYGAGTPGNAAGYPPPPQGRPAMPSGTPGHYPYGSQYDRERFEQTPLGPNQSNVILPHGQSSDPNMYPTPHRYPNHQMMPRPYGASAPIAGQPTNVGPNSTNQLQGPPNQTNPPGPASGPYQPSTSPQDPNYQNYSGNQSNMYSSQNKMISTYGHQGPKRHPDFLKLPENQYPPFSGPSPGPQPTQPPNTTAAPSSVPNSSLPQTPPTQQSPPQQQQQPPPLPANMYPGWRNDAQFPQYPNQAPAAPPASQLQPPIPAGAAREEWDNRRPNADPNVPNSHWSGMHPRYPPQSTGPPSSNQGPTPSQQPPPQPPHSSGGYYYQNNGVVPPPGPNQMLVPPAPSPPSTNARMRMPMPMPRDKQQPPLQPPFPQINQAKIAPPQMMTNAQYAPKKEIVFPENTVEAVAPLLVKRRRLGARDIIPVEAWRLMMALKSGLLCESTWALDVLSVLLYDEAAVLYFNLQHLPGLLDVLLEHYRKCLVQMFNLEKESMLLQPPPLPAATTTTTDGRESPSSSSNKWYLPPPETEEHACSRLLLQDLGAVADINPNDKIALLDGENYTYRTSRGKSVKVVSCADLFVSDERRAWDEFNDYDKYEVSKSLHLSGDLTSHIQTHFVMERRGIPFVRVMKDERLIKKENEDTKDDREEVEKVKEEEENADETEIKSKTPINNIVVVNNNNKSELEVESEKESAAAECSAIIIKQEVMECDSELVSEVPPEQAASCTENVVVGVVVEEAEDPSTRCGKKRKRWVDEYEDEAYNRDEASLYLVDDGQDSLARRAICLSNILRSLSFVPGNDTELSKSQSILSVLGKLLLLHHEHAPRKASSRNYDKDDEPDVLGSCSSLYGEKEWWWEALHVLRENTLVTLANISGRLDLSIFPERVGLPILDGLLHWAVCPSAYALDPLPSLPPQSILSPQRLSLEALCKLSVQENNVDLIMATPPFSRVERLFAFLSRSLGRYEDQVVREFAVVLLHYFSQADSGVARNIALQNQSISLLIAFVEQAEQNAVQVANTHGINLLRENPDMMGTSLDMLRRAAHTLFCLAQVPDNRSLFVQHQHRLLQLVTSQILDQHVASIVADVLFECSTDDLEPS